MGRFKRGPLSGKKGFFNSRRGPKREPKITDLSVEWELGKEFPHPTTESKISESTRRQLLQSRSRAFLVKTPAPKLQLGIVLFLQRNGIFIPRVIAQDKKHRILAFEPARKPIRIPATEIHKEQRESPFPAAHTSLGGMLDLLHRKNNFEALLTNAHAKKLVYKTFRLIGRVQSLGVCHGHPHAGNIVFYKGKAGLIDFKKAHRVLPEIWKDPNRIFINFEHDYNNLAQTAHQYFFPTNYRQIQDYMRVFKSLFSALVARYPCSQKIKNKVLQMILADNSWRWNIA